MAINNLQLSQTSLGQIHNYINDLDIICGELIRDRTQADVDFALNLERDGGFTDEDLKGAYNISDRNRVGGAINYIAECLRDTGRHEVRTKVRDDWDFYDIIKPGDNQKVLAALKYLKLLLPYNQTEEVPESLDCLTYQKANAVENILFDLCGVFSRIFEAWLFCGDAFMFVSEE